MLATGFGTPFDRLRRPFGHDFRTLIIAVMIAPMNSRAAIHDHPFTLVYSISNQFISNQPRAISPLA